MPISGIQRKRIGLVAMCAIAILGAGVIFIKFVPDSVLWRDEIKQGDEIVRKVEAYRKVRGQLPSAIGDLNVGEVTENRIYYQQCDQSRYIVWFSTTLGKSLTYDSRSHEWVPLNVTCS